MEEQKVTITNDGETRYFHIENIGKNLVTTIIGVVLMTVSAGTFILSWFIDLPLMKDKTWHVVGVFALGFALLFMRDKISSYADIFIKKKIDSK